MWGCFVYYKDNNPKITKLKDVEYVFVGYFFNCKIYRLLNLESNMIIELKDVESFEHYCPK